MSLASNSSKVSPAEYFAYLDSIEGKAEFYNGIIVDMAGGSPNHSLITMNCGIAIGRQLDGTNCAAYSPDLLVGLDIANAYVFPDLTIACGKLERDPSNRNIAKNPQVIVEVLSPSSIDLDRTSKLIRYMQIPSLREYILIEQVKPQVDICFINENGVWDSEKVIGLDGIVKIRSLGIEISMASIYRLVEFEG
jgi:Uma2 family endonuclease